MGDTNNQETPPPDLSKININEPRYDQDSYFGRALHFIKLTNPLNIFASSEDLENAKCIITKHKAGDKLPPCITEDALWRAKTLYDSAYHPDTGEKMFVIGRMSAQVPMNVLIVTAMLTFYKSTPIQIFLQWFNQSFMALANFTNRGGDNVITKKQLTTSYVCATSGALLTVLTLKHLVKKMPPIGAKLIPFAAIAAANCINVPLMRVQELKMGTPIFDDHYKKLGYSKHAAQDGISQVIFTRIMTSLPSMVFTPMIMTHLEREGHICRYPWANVPLQVFLVGFFYIIATPLACAIFKQKAEFRFKDLEPELKEKLMKQFHNKPPYYVFYNRGL